MLRLILIFGLSVSVLLSVQAGGVIEELDEDRKSSFNSITSVSGKSESNLHLKKASFDGPGILGSPRGNLNGNNYLASSSGFVEEKGYAEDRASVTAGGYGSARNSGSITNNLEDFEGTSSPGRGQFQPNSIPSTNYGSPTATGGYGAVNTGTYGSTNGASYGSVAGNGYGRSNVYPPADSSKKSDAGGYGSYGLAQPNIDPPVDSSNIYGAGGYGSNGLAQPNAYSPPDSSRNYGAGGYGSTNSYGAYVPPPMQPYPYGHHLPRPSNNEGYPGNYYQGGAAAYPPPPSQNSHPYQPPHQHQHQHHHQPAHQHPPHAHPHHNHEHHYEGPHGFRILDHTFKTNTEYKENGEHSGSFKELNSNGNCGYGSGFCGGYNGAFVRPGY